MDSCFLAFDFFPYWLLLLLASFYFFSFIFFFYTFVKSFLAQIWNRFNTTLMNFRLYSNSCPSFSTYDFFGFLFSAFYIQFVGQFFGLCIGDVCAFQPPIYGLFYVLGDRWMKICFFFSSSGCLFNFCWGCLLASFLLGGWQIRKQKCKFFLFLKCTCI